MITIICMITVGYLVAKAHGLLAGLLAAVAAWLIVDTVGSLVIAALMGRK